MGSVISTIECPQCGGLYTTDYYYKTGEEYRSCARCGRHEEWEIVRGEDGKPVLDEKGHWQMKYELSDGYGSMRLADKNGFAQIYSLSQPVDQDLIDDFNRALEDPDIDKDGSYLSSWDPEKKELVMIYGKMPESFAEFDERVSKEEAADEQIAAVSESSGT